MAASDTLKVTITLAGAHRVIDQLRYLSQLLAEQSAHFRAQGGTGDVVADAYDYDRDRVLDAREELSNGVAECLKFMG